MCVCVCVENTLLAVICSETALWQNMHLVSQRAFPAIWYESRGCKNMQSSRVQENDWSLGMETRMETESNADEDGLHGWERSNGRVMA